MTVPYTTYVMLHRTKQEYENGPGRTCLNPHDCLRQHEHRQNLSRKSLWEATGKPITGQPQAPEHPMPQLKTAFEAPVRGGRRSGCCVGEPRYRASTLVLYSHCIQI